jgi:putative tryptophan/tyrosine transport system substrate-binding protein
MKRREFITLLGGTAVASSLSRPLASQAQPATKIPRIGIIDDSPMWHSFRRGLRDLGYLEGQNIAFEYRYADGAPERLAEAAAELVRRPVDVIATFGTPSTRAAKQATSTIPILMIGIGDPIRAQLVASLAQPGGNITGNTILSPDLGPKRLQLIKELIPSVRRVALLWNGDNASNLAIFEELTVAAPAAGMTLISLDVRNVADFDSAFAAMTPERADAVLMTNDPFHQLHVGRIVDFLAERRLPGQFQAREYVAAGGLMSYGASLPDLFRRGALYVHRILQGAKPADLPIEGPTKFELVLNLNTAKRLGLTVPESFLLRVDEVIE